MIGSKIVAVTEEQRDQNRPRQLRTHLRKTARQLARDHALNAIVQVVADVAPDWFTPEQECSYKAELRRLAYRIGSRISVRNTPTLAPAFARGRA